MIKSYRSPNFDDRTLPVTMLVMHYTGMETGQVAIDRLCDPEAKVSAHYVIEEDGRIFNLVDEDRRAWHAGLSCWSGITNVNSASIGIEIVNGGHDYGLPDFPATQIDAVTSLSQDIITRHKIDMFNVVGHSDIAPARKQDPGEKFPWASLAKKGVGYFPKHKEGDRRIVFRAEQRDRGISIMQRGLSFLGYDVAISGTLDQHTQDVISAFQRRYRTARIDGNIDIETMELVSVLNQKKSKEKPPHNHEKP